MTKHRQRDGAPTPGPNRQPQSFFSRLFAALVAMLKVFLPALIVSVGLFAGLVYWLFLS